jgi:hypothetical protein
MFERLRAEERGVAMIISIAVAFIVLLLSTVVVAQSIHSLESSGYDRERLLSVNAAEAGTNYWYAFLETTPPGTMAANAGCDAGTGKLTISDVVQSGPSPAAFTSIGTFYAANGSTEMKCSTFSDTNYPSFVKVESTGTINGSPNRTIETYVRLTPNYGGFGAAILAVNSPTFQGNFTVNGNSGNDGDIYALNGNLTIQNSMTVYGNMYVPFGSAELHNNAVIKGNLWARDDVDLENPATVESAALSSEGDIVGSGFVNGDATAGGDVDDSSLTIGGSITEFVSMPDVPTQTFPTITWDAAAWTADGYTINTYSGSSACTEAKTFINGTWSGNYVVRITGSNPCTLTYSGPTTNISVNGNLAVVTDWGISLQNRSNWNGIGSTKNLHFLSVAPAASCPPSGTSNKNIEVGNLTSFNSTNVSFYTPCKATMNNQNAFSGQVLAKDVVIGNNFTMSYKPVLVPGTTGVTGFKQDISYIHE